MGRFNCVTIFLILHLLYNPSISLCAQNVTNAYIITGDISDLPDGVLIYLIRLSNGDTICKASSDHGRFTLRGHYEEVGEMHFVKYDSTGLNLPKKTQTWIRIYFDNQPISIRGSLSEWPNLEISGSPSTEVYNSILDQLSIIHQQSNEKIRSSNWDSAVISKILDEANLRIVECLMKFPTEWATADLGRKSPNLKFNELRTIYESLSSPVRLSFPGRMLKERMKQRQPENLIQENNIIPSFSINGRDGKLQLVMELIKNSKYTLFDFWASWCKPCVEEIPSIRREFEKYSRSELQVIGVSIDKKKQDWLTALEQIKPEWIQGLDVNGEIANKVFGIRSIPAYLLVDSTGRMVAFYCAMSENRSFGRDIKGPGLSETLLSILR